MPRIIRDFSNRPIKHFPSIVKRLVEEMHTDHEFGQPLVEEHRFPNTEMTRIIVIWDDFDGLSEDDRINVVLDAYDQVEGTGTRNRIAYVIAMTYPEAREAGLLPVKIVTMIRADDPFDIDQVREVMMRQGASILASPQRPQLLFRNVDEAQACMRRLEAELPNSQRIWGIERDARYDHDD